MNILHKLYLNRHIAPGWPPFGQGRAHRYFEKGFLKFILLDMLREKPRHGYDLIRELEERSHGFYTPSPGSIYPVLQKLQEKGMVSSEDQEGRKTYTITDEGLKLLEERAGVVEHLKHISEHRALNFNKAEWQDTIEELHHMRQLFGKKMGNLSERQIIEIKKTIKNACRDIETIIQE
ncbi:MAG: PadR family transcriptional regulator [Dehalogenimonas sp.]